tara:strand:- start:182 stop:445 length:264 start_codon:yes stop_codon:yes gene_type:complete
MYEKGDSIPKSITYINHNEEIIEEKESFPPIFSDYDFARLLGGEGQGSDKDSLLIIYANTKIEFFLCEPPFIDSISNDATPCEGDFE